MTSFKLYVDSRFRQEVGGANSDTEFAIELPRPINVTGRAFVDTFICPNSFYTIRAGENDRLHVRENISTYRVCTIAEGQYNSLTLKDAVLAALQTGKSIAGDYKVLYDIPTNKLRIDTLDPTAAFTIYPTSWLQRDATTWNIGSFASGGPIIDSKHLMDAGAVLGFATGGLLLGNAVTSVTAPGVTNVLPYHQLFLRSNLGNGNDTFGADGSSDIIRRVTVQVGLNEMIVDQHTLPYDSVSSGSREISSLRFSLTDVFGKVVDTHGHPISFSIIFVPDE
jgi:hypothetical protein